MLIVPCHQFRSRRCRSGFSELSPVRAPQQLPCQAIGLPLLVPRLPRPQASGLTWEPLTRRGSCGLCHSHRERLPSSPCRPLAPVPTLSRLSGLSRAPALTVPTPGHPLQLPAPACPCWGSPMAAWSHLAMRTLDVSDGKVGVTAQPTPGGPQGVSSAQAPRFPMVLGGVGSQKGAACRSL